MVLSKTRQEFDGTTHFTYLLLYRPIYFVRIDSRHPTADSRQFMKLEEDFILDSILAGLKDDLLIVQVVFVFSLNRN